MGNLSWCDLETTGLDPAKDLLLEVGCIVTTPDLREVARASWLVRHPREELEVAINGADEVVMRMHSDNGLWVELLRGEGLKTLAEIESEYHALLAKHGCVGVTATGRTYRSPLCGSTPSFDRGFLKANLPKVERAHTHRHIDVSTVHALAGLWYDGMLHESPLGEGEGAVHHRALYDLEHAIARLKYYRGHLFSPHHRVPAG